MMSNYNPEIGHLQSEAENLMLSTAWGDRKLDEIIRRASACHGKAQCIKDFQSFVDSVNSCTTNGKRREVLLTELQRENKLIMAYQEENRILKEAVEDCFNTIDTVMKKHRSTMQRARNDLAIGEIGSCVSSPGSKSSERKQRMKAIVNDLNTHVQRGEDVAHNGMQRVSQLRQEYAVLREMLATSEISHPGAGRLFNKLLRLLKERKTDVLSDSEDEDNLNNTMREVKPPAL